MVIGRNGQVAAAMAQIGVARSHDVYCYGRNDINILSKNAVTAAISKARPDAILNAAAFTAVDEAERDRDAAYALNLEAPRLLAEVAAVHDIPFVHLSTDYVFDGTKPTPYLPDDPVKPINVYGASKAAGESAVASVNPKAVILRTAWVYSDTGSNFIKTILARSTRQEELRIVDDQIGNPTFADDIANACLTIAAYQISNYGSAAGLYHFAGQGDTSRYEFAQAILDEAYRQANQMPCRLVPIKSSEYPSAALRPANSTLDCSTTKAKFGIAFQPWQIGLGICLERLLK